MARSSVSNSRTGPDGGTFLHMLYELDFPTWTGADAVHWRIMWSSLATLVADQIERVTPTPTPSLRG